MIRLLYIFPWGLKLLKSLRILLSAILDSFFQSTKEVRAQIDSLVLPHIISFNFCHNWLISNQTRQKIVFFSRAATCPIMRSAISLVPGNARSTSFYLQGNEYSRDLLQVKRELDPQMSDWETHDYTMHPLSTMRHWKSAFTHPNSRGNSEVYFMASDGIEKA